MESEPPFFAIHDDGYERILNKLRNGSTHEWSFAGVCPHRNKSDCNCQRFKNVLDPNDSSKIVRIVDGVAKPVLRSSDVAQRVGDTNYETEINIYPNMFSTRPDYADYLKSLPMTGSMPAKFPLKVNVVFETMDPMSTTVPDFESFCTIVDKTELGAAKSMQGEEPDACMTTWKLLSSKITEKIGTKVVLSIDRSDDDAQRHMASIKAAFKKCKKQKRNGDVLLTNGGGPLQHTFPSCAEPEPAELIGVPKVDVMFFISNDGRVDAVGSRAEEMKALLEV